MPFEQFIIKYINRNNKQAIFSDIQEVKYVKSYLSILVNILIVDKCTKLRMK